MKKMFRKIFVEFVWLIGLSGLTFLLLVVFFGKLFFRNTLDIHLHDSYFVFTPTHIFLVLFLLLSFVIYFVRTLYNSFQHSLPCSILIVFGFALMIVVTFLVKSLSQFGVGSWTLYPPLSALGPTELEPDPTAKHVSNFLVIVQVLILAILLFATFKRGKNGVK